MRTGTDQATIDAANLILDELRKAKEARRALEEPSPTYGAYWDGRIDALRDIRLYVHLILARAKEG